MGTAGTTVGIRTDSSRIRVYLPRAGRRERASQQPAAVECAGLGMEPAALMGGGVVWQVATRKVAHKQQ